jgi:hypothetical protein
LPARYPIIAPAFHLPPVSFATQATLLTLNFPFIVARGPSTIPATTQDVALAQDNRFADDPEYPVFTVHAVPTWTA